jgi:hypothetical protein
MTPQEKAEDLYGKFLQYVPAEEEFEHEYAKKCVLITVDEILEEYPSQCPPDSYEMERHLYWTEVKKEIEKL